MNPDSPPPSTSHSRSTTGVLFALGGFGWWAWITPLYFYVLRSVPVLELLAWRVIAGAPTLLLLLWLLGRQGEVRDAFRNRRVLCTLTASAILLSVKLDHLRLGGHHRSAGRGESWVLHQPARVGFPRDGLSWGAAAWVPDRCHRNSRWRCRGHDRGDRAHAVDLDCARGFVRVLRTPAQDR